MLNGILWKLWRLSSFPGFSPDIFKNKTMQGNFSNLQMPKLAISQILVLRNTDILKMVKCLMY